MSRNESDNKTFSDDTLPTLTCASDDTEEEEQDNERALSNQVQVSFMIYAPAQSVESPVTLLTSDKINNGSVDMYLDDAGEIFMSDLVPAEIGEHEVQLCFKYSDGYEDMFPLKKFEVKQDNEPILLHMETKKSTSYSQQPQGQSYQMFVLYPPGTSPGQDPHPTRNHSESNIQHLSDEPYQGDYGHHQGQPLHQGHRFHQRTAALPGQYQSTTVNNAQFNSSKDKKYKPASREYMAGQNTARSGESGQNVYSEGERPSHKAASSWATTRSAGVAANASSKELQKKVDDLQSEREGMLAVIHGNCKKISELEDKLKVKERLLESQKDTLRQEKENGKRLMTKLSFLEEEKAALYQKMEGYRDMMSKYDLVDKDTKHLIVGVGVGETADLKEQLQLVNLELQHLQEQHKLSEKAVLQKQRELLEMEGLCKEFEARFEKSTNKNENLSNQCKTLKLELEAKSSELAQRTADLLHKQAGHEQELTELKREKEKLLHEVVNLRNLVEHPTKYQELIGENEHLKDNVGRLELIISDEKEKVEKYKSRAAELQGQLREATDEERLSAVQRKVHEYRKERDDLRTENERLNRRIQGLQQTQDLIQSRLVDYNLLKAEVQRYQQQMTSLSEQDGAEVQSLVSSESAQVSCEPSRKTHGLGEDSLPGEVGSLTGKESQMLSSGISGSSEVKYITVDGQEYPCVPMTTALKSVKLGIKVLVSRRNGDLEWGTLHFFKESEDIVGIELVKPSGKTDGYSEKLNKQCFKCTQKHGHFTSQKHVYLPMLSDESYQV